MYIILLCVIRKNITYSMNIYWLNRYLHFFRRFIKYWKEIDEVKEILFEITLKIEMSEIMSETYRIK